MLPIIVIIIFFLLLFFIRYKTTRKYSPTDYYLASNRTPWYIIAIGMIGSSISGVTFISVPGWILTSDFSYLQMAMGFIVGYIIVAKVLLPVYYRMKLTSIYQFLNGRFGTCTYKTGACYFLLSRTLITALRLFLAVMVLQFMVFDQFGIPFELILTITILLVFAYTFKGGLRTVIWTDMVQTLIFLVATAITFCMMLSLLNFNLIQGVQAIMESPHSKIFVWDVNNPNHFIKLFLTGIFTVIAMTGTDQDQMQKNLACRNIREAQKNMYTYGTMFLPINALFLSLGVLLTLYLQNCNIPLPTKGDTLFPTVIELLYKTHPSFMGTTLYILFLLGILAAAYSSLDGALTTLTTSFMTDILNLSPNTTPKTTRLRTAVHFSFAIAITLIVMLFKVLNSQSVIAAIYTMAGYTYGPLLGLFIFGIFFRFRPLDRYVPIILLLSPCLTYALNYYAFRLFHYQFGFELLILNALITFVGLLSITHCTSKI